MVEPLLLTATRIVTVCNGVERSNASGFFFQDRGRLFVVTCLHVLCDPTSGHYPDTIEIEIHVDRVNLTRVVKIRLPLYASDAPCWLGVSDLGGGVDIAGVEIPRDLLPPEAFLCAFMEKDPPESTARIERGTAMLVLGFPLGFHDALHHLPVARQAINASSFDLRFQGQGYFLTDSRTHRGVAC